MGGVPRRGVKSRYGLRRGKEEKKLQEGGDDMITKGTKDKKGVQLKKRDPPLPIIGLMDIKLGNLILRRIKAHFISTLFFYLCLPSFRCLIVSLK